MFEEHLTDVAEPEMNRDGVEVPGEAPRLRGREEPAGFGVRGKLSGGLRAINLAGVVLVLAVSFGWSYWPTIVDLVDTWETQPDYSHGYLVVPFAIYLLWARRDLFPGGAGRVAWWGLAPIGLSVGMRYVGAQWYLGSVDAWSMILWLAGVAWMLGGWRVLTWSLPGLAFLVFMVPLPWRYERLLSVPLQKIATRASCWVLQLLGEPAMASGNTLVFEQQRLDVAAACAGLRIFIGAIAIAYLYAVLCRRGLWERLFLLVLAPPIAVVANVARIVVTGMLYQHADGETAEHFFHDTAGWAMILFAASLYGLVLWYFTLVAREAEVVDTASVITRHRGS
ncbi:MAG: exosortase/archaeosortase family protein [Planctomycetota bacterium]